MNKPTKDFVMAKSKPSKGGPKKDAPTPDSNSGEHCDCPECVAIKKR